MELHDLSLLLSTMKMELQVCYNFATIEESPLYLYLYTAVVNNDYVPVSGQIIQFNRGDVTQTHTITINDDDECERDQNESLFSNISLDSSIPDITVTLPQATVTIDDTAEPECGKYKDHLVSRRGHGLYQLVCLLRTNHCWL